MPPKKQGPKIVALACSSCGEHFSPNDLERVVLESGKPVIKQSVEMCHCCARKASK